MLSELCGEKTLVGLKQSSAAVREGLVAHAFIAEDADEHVRTPFLAICNVVGVPVTMVDSMVRLGRACKINVGAAVAVLLK